MNRLSIINGFKACGIAIWVESDDTTMINAITINRTGKKLAVQHKITTSKIEEFPNHIPGNIPVYLSIDGKGVIHKVFDEQPEGSMLDILLPNADPDDFVLQQAILSENKLAVSVARKDKVEEIINKINEKGNDVIKVSLGPFSLSNLSQIHAQESLINVPRYTISIKNHFIESFEKTINDNPDFSLDIESCLIESQFIIPFCNSLSHFFTNHNLTIDCQATKSQVENYRYKRLFQLCGWSILIFLFTALLFNYLLFDNYRKKNQLLISQIGSNKAILGRIERMKLQIKTKEDFFKRNSSYTNPLFAYYSDRIAKDVPPEITLSKLCLSPMQKTLKEDVLLFQQDKLIISGTAHNSSNLDSWIKSIENLGWINDIVIRNFSANAIVPAKFELEVTLNGHQK